MMSFAAILDPACCAVGAAAADKDAAIAAAVGALVAGGRLRDSARLLEETRARERLSSTGIGDGVAVPHALCDAVAETVMSVVRLAEPVDFDAVDGRPVDLVFFMAGPRSATADHLKILSKLARVLHDEDFRRAARAAPDGPALARLLFDRD